LEGGPPIFNPGFTSPSLLYRHPQFTVTGLSPSSVRHSNASAVIWLIRFRSPLLTESRLLSFPAGTEMFQFSAFALHPYTFRVKYPCGWVAPFGNPRITARLPAPLGLSQVPASFIASRHQDIHHVPLCSVIPTGRRGFPRGCPRLLRIDRLAYLGAPKGGPTHLAPDPPELVVDQEGQHFRLARCIQLSLQLSVPPPGDLCVNRAETPAWQATTTLPPTPQDRLGDMFIRIRLSKSRHKTPGFPGFWCRFHPSACPAWGGE
jgi:hypothetical protein